MRDNFRPNVRLTTNILMVIGTFLIAFNLSSVNKQNKTLSTANTESYWLILTYGTVGKFGAGGLEKIEMSSLEACQKEGKQWEGSPTQGEYSTVRKFHCVVGK